MQMLHPDGSGPARPIDVPILIGALGPEGPGRRRAVRRRVRHHHPRGPRARRLRLGGLPLLGHGPRRRARTCRRSGCSPPPGRAAPSPTTPPTSCTAATPCPTSPAARSGWRSSTSGREDERHLDVHVGHCIHLNAADRAAWATTGGALLPSTTITGTADEIKARIDELGEQGSHRGRLPTVRPRHPPRAGGDARSRRWMTPLPEVVRGNARHPNHSK